MWAEDGVRADEYAATLQARNEELAAENAERGLRIADLESENRILITISTEALRRAAHLTDICWAQRIALDDRSREDDNYSQGTEAHRHLEEAIAQRERANKLRFRAPSLPAAGTDRQRRRRAA
jgi:hypothetical protein